MPLKGALCISALALISSSVSAQDPDQTRKEDWARIASTSLCGDSYLQAFAPNQIMALSWQSRGPLSRASEAQKALPQAWDDAERLIALSPDIVLFGPGEGHKSEAILQKAGIDTIRLDWAEDVVGILDNYAKLGVMFIPGADRIYDEPKPKMLYLSRSGGSAGVDTFVNAVIEQSGGVNVMTRKGWFTPDAERLAALKPDIIIRSYMNQGFESAQAKLVTGGVHKRVLERAQIVDVPGKLWPCAGPGYFDALALVREAADEWRAKQAAP